MEQMKSCEQASLRQTLETKWASWGAFHYRLSVSKEATVGITD